MAAFPACGELLLDCLTTVAADPALPGARPWPEEFLEYRLRDRVILLAFDQNVHGALGEGDFAGKAHEVLVTDAATYPGGLKQIFEVMRVNQVVRRENRLHSCPRSGSFEAVQPAPSASIFAAQMKSFSEMPPTECVLNSTRQRL